MTQNLNFWVFFQTPANSLPPLHLPAVIPKRLSFAIDVWFQQYPTCYNNSKKKQNNKKTKNKNTYIFVLHYSYSVAQNSRSSSLVEPTPSRSQSRGPSAQILVEFLSCVSTHKSIPGMFIVNVFSLGNIMRTIGRCSERFIVLQCLAICLPDNLHLILASGQMLFFTGHAFAGHTREHCIDRSWRSNTTQNLRGFIHY